MTESRAAGRAKGEKFLCYFKYCSTLREGPKKETPKGRIGSKCFTSFGTALTGLDVLRARRCRSLPAVLGRRTSPGKWLRYAPVFTPPPGLPLPKGKAWRRGHGRGRRVRFPPGEANMSAAHISNEKLLDKATAQTYMLGVSLVKVVSNPNGGDALG